MLGYRNRAQARAQGTVSRSAMAGGRDRCAGLSEPSSSSSSRYSILFSDGWGSGSLCWAIGTELKLELEVQYPVQRWLEVGIAVLGCRNRARAQGTVSRSAMAGGRDCCAGLSEPSSSSRYSILCRWRLSDGSFACPRTHSSFPRSHQFGSSFLHPALGASFTRCILHSVLQGFRSAISTVFLTSNSTLRNRSPLPSSFPAQTIIILLN